MWVYQSFLMRKTQAHILVIDDQEDILFTAKILLKKYFKTVHTLSNPKNIVQLLSENKIDVVLLDMNYRIGYEDGREGIYLLKEIKKLSPHTVVVLMTAFGKVETAVEGLKSGAFDYLLKPWDNKKLIETVKSAVKEGRKHQKQQYKVSKETVYFVGTSAAVKKAYELADKVAKTDANVLILGENGTGKYVMAKHIHQQSERKDNVFVHVDLGALSESIFESELFGYAKGAFTDAKTDTAGRFEAAENGTIFLDEIGNIPLHLQAKLLQIIQNRKVTRLGESKPRPINARIVTATNKNLKEEVENQCFREDLYYRINTMEIELPPLRKCDEDKLPLADFLLQKMIRKYQRTNVVFSKEAQANIQQHIWNGNVREMENRIERAIILCEKNIITANDLDLNEVELTRKQPNNLDLQDIEKNTIEQVLKKNEFNISKSAEELGLSRAALYRRIEKYNIK